MLGVIVASVTAIICVESLAAVVGLESVVFPPVVVVPSVCFGPVAVEIDVLLLEVDEEEGFLELFVVSEAREVGATVAVDMTLHPVYKLFKPPQMVLVL